MALITLNGHKYFLNADSVEVVPVSNGRWEVKYTNYGVEASFIVVGGYKSGGAKNEWFCYHPTFFGEQWMPVNSMIKAIKLGIQY